VQSASKTARVACGNCVVACPFGVPEPNVEQQLIERRDMCHDRTSAGKQPMCATVCPSQASFFGTREQVEQPRPRGTPTNRFRFGNQTIDTRVNPMVPRDNVPRHVDVTAATDDRATGRSVSLNVAIGPAPAMCNGGSARAPASRSAGRSGGSSRDTTGDHRPPAREGRTGGGATAAPRGRPARRSSPTHDGRQGRDTLLPCRNAKRGCLSRGALRAKSKISRSQPQVSTAHVQKP
jgi:NAD-dependent dihydropyrimidine dehydrogenase PreA subunit